MLTLLKRRLLAFLTLACLLPASARASAEAEDELKAAVVLSFLRYGEWSAAPTPNAPLTVGVFGRAGFASVLRKSLEGKTANEHPVHVVDLRTAAGEPGCELVYFADDKTVDTKAVLQSAAMAHALTIGESKEFLDWGGAVRLFVLDGRITFEVNLDTLEHSGVNISSRLLRFGQIRNSKKGAVLRLDGALLEARTFSQRALCGSDWGLPRMGLTHSLIKTNATRCVVRNVYGGERL